MVGNAGELIVMFIAAPGWPLPSYPFSYCGLTW